MSSSYRMRWRPALGVLVLGSIAIGLGIKGASAEKARVAARDKSKDVPQAGVVSTPRPVAEAKSGPVAKGAETQQSKSVKKNANLPEGAVAVPSVVGGVERPANWIEPDELPSFTGVEALIGQAPTFVDVGSQGTVAAGTTGACCLACGGGGCVANQTALQCSAAGGVYQGNKSTCANDICGCNLRACCNPAGTCIGDQTRAVCEGAGNTWNADADCNVGSNALPSPFCNVYNANNCNWDNGAPLNDGGASRAHTFSGAPGGQLPRYDFSTADDFILRGLPGDVTACQVGSINWYVSARPSDTAGPPFTPPDPANDFVGINVTVYRNFLHPQTGFDQPGGRGLVPANEDDLNPKISDTPGGVVYARSFLNNEGAVAYTFQPGFCDPPPAVATESGSVWEVVITIDPPILLNKSVKYWLDVQGLFPFNDGLRETLQSWWMPSVNNTLIRGRTYRTANTNYTPLAVPNDLCATNADCAAYVGGHCDTAVVTGCSVNADCPAGSTCIDGDGVAGAPNPGVCSALPGGAACSVTADCPAGSVCANGDNIPGAPNPGTCAVPAPLCRFQAWEPIETSLIGGTPTQRGNQGAVAPCAAVPLRTRLDFAFKLNGVKDPAGPPANNLCANVFAAPNNAFDGANPFDNTGATTDGPASCVVNQDLWFRYSATCTGVLTVKTCDSSFNSAVAVYENLGCPGVGTELGCNTAACGDDGSVQVVVGETADLLIRVGGDGVSVGKGILHIECDTICGQPDNNPLVNNCCIDHSNSPPSLANLGCENPICCNVVCTTPGEETCCDDSAASGGWDSECAMVAEASEVCGCPCLSFACVNGETLEPMCSSPEGNAGCSVAAPPAGPMEPDTALTLGVGVSKCGRLHTTTTTRDVDWWAFDVPATVSTFATLTISLNSTTQAGLLVFGRETPPDFGAGEDRCFDKVCSGATACGGQVACDEDADCQTLENPTGTCDTVGTTLLLFDAIATSGCQATDGMGDHCDPLVTCVPAPGEYYVVGLTAQAADDDCTLGDGIFTGVTCGASDTYGFTITATNGCTNGACCTFSGGCEDGSPGTARNEYQCFLAGGTFQGEGVNCEDAGILAECADLAHGCATAPTIVCGQTIAVDLTTDDHIPEEGYPCGAAGNDPNDRAWLKFTAPCVNDGAGPDCNDEAGPDVTSVRLDTCSSTNPGRDSLLAIFGSCCPPSGICPSGAQCTPGEHLCGGACNAATPFDVAGCSDDVCGFTDFLSDICAQDLIEGEQYFIEVSNWAEPVNGVYQLRLTCPCAGSCCDAATAVCMDGVAADNCAEPLRFSTQETCAQLVPACGVGACCAPNGTCTNVTAANCPATSNHNPGSACSTIVCNVDNTCDYNTGDPTSDLSQAPFGFRSQYAQDIDLFLEIADQFEMKGSPDNGCEISSITYTTFHTSHDTANGCLAGGAGTGCTDKASEYDGIIVTISEDVVGDEKGPSCEPDCTATDCQPGADMDYHTDGPGCQSYRFGAALGEDDPIPTNNYWTYVENCQGQCEFFITLTFQPPILVEKNKKNWLSVVHLVPEANRYSVIVFSSANFNGNFSQAYNSLGTQDFEPLDGTPNDQLFSMLGTKQTVGCGVCQLFGDIAPLPATKCLVDVDDLLCALDSFGGPGTPCGDAFLGDIVISGGGCGPDGVDDVDDILAVLDAFSSLATCPNICEPGACVGDFTDDGPGVTCRDGDPTGAFFVGNGMSQSDCNTLTGGTGTYCGDNTLCDPDATCPGSP